MINIFWVCFLSVMLSCVVIHWLTVEIKQGTVKHSFILYNVNFLFLWLWESYHLPFKYTAFDSSPSSSKVALPELTLPFQEVDYVCVRFCGDGAQHQTSRTGPNVTLGHSQTTRRTHRPDSQTHSRGNTTAVKTKGHSFFSCFLFWESCPGSSPSQQSWELLVQGFPHRHGYNNTCPIRLTGPVTLRHAKTHHIRPQPGWACTQAHLP